MHTHLYFLATESGSSPIHRHGYPVDVRQLEEKALVHVDRQSLWMRTNQ